MNLFCAQLFFASPIGHGENWIKIEFESGFVFLHFFWGHLLLFFRHFIFTLFYKGKMAKISPKIKDGHFWQKWPFSDHKKWHFEWPNQNSMTTFIVQTFPKYGPYDFYFMNLSLLGAILAIFQFCRFSGLFWPFFPCKKG